MVKMKRVILMRYLQLGKLDRWRQARDISADLSIEYRTFRGVPSARGLGRLLLELKEKGIVKTKTVGGVTIWKKEK